MRLHPLPQTLPVHAITQWIDPIDPAQPNIPSPHGQTALCPLCGLDCIVSLNEAPLQEASPLRRHRILRLLQRYWFPAGAEDYRLDLPAREQALHSLREQLQPPPRKHRARAADAAIGALTDPITAHRHSRNHRAEILQSTVCGCFYCLQTFNPSAITWWWDAPETTPPKFLNLLGQTATCPHCRDRFRIWIRHHCTAAESHACALV